MYRINVQMKRGGFIPLDVQGRVFMDSYGVGDPFPVTEIDGIFWPRGGVVRQELVADMEQVKEGLREAVAKLKDDK